MSRVKVTASLLNSWLYATDCEATDAQYESFLSTLAQAKTPPTSAMLEGIAFEDKINAYVLTGALDEQREVVKAFGDRLIGGQLQVRWEQPERISGVDVLLVGVADCVKAGVISDIKRVQRYEYGKYQHSPQHPMYMKLCPTALKFDYLIYDGAYCYSETYRRGDYSPIEQTIETFFHFLRGADLWGIYEKHWKTED